MEHQQGTSASESAGELIGKPVRHPGDFVRVVVGIVVVVVGAALIRLATVTRFEENIFQFFNELPSMVRAAFGVVEQLGNVFASLALAIAALVWTRKKALPLTLIAAGVSGWFLAKGIKALVGRGRPADLLESVLSNGPVLHGIGYPSGHATVAAALAAAATPYLSRRWRRLAWGFVWLVAMGRMATGAHFPLDVVGGVALGWALGSVWHLVIGSPPARSSLNALAAALTRNGLAVTAVHQLTVDARGSIPLRIECGTDTYFGKALLGLHRDADWLFKLWRRVSLKKVEDETPFVSIKQQVEHEAYLGMLAERAGVATPAVVAASPIDTHSAILVTEWTNGKPLSAEDESVPDDLWMNVGMMHAGHIAHRDLRMSNVVVTNGASQLVDFGFAEAAASDDRIAIDVAELLVNTALIVGPTEALRLARDAVPRQRLETAARYLQPLALAGATRQALRHIHDLLDELREGLIGEHPPPLVPLARFRLRNLAYVLVLGVVVHVMLPQIAEFETSFAAFGSADYWLLGAALVASALSYVATAWSVTGTTSAVLSLTRTTLVQLANQFLNILAPAGIAGFSTNVRFLVGHGVATESAIAGVGLSMVVSAIVHFVLLLATAVWIGTSVPTLPSVPEKWVIVAAVAAIALTAGIVATAFGREKVLAPARVGLKSLGPVLRDTRRATALFGGAIAVNVTNIMALYLALRAVGAPASLAQASGAYLIGAIVGSVTPTPGGLGGTEAALVAALTGLGLATTPVVAGVLAFRAATFWIPLGPGALAARYLRHEHIL